MRRNLAAAGSQVTKTVAEDVEPWQNRPLDEIYPIVYLDAIRIKVRQDGRVINNAVYLAIGVNLEGLKGVFGLWTIEIEGTKFWLTVVTELKNRGVKDILSLYQPALCKRTPVIDFDLL